MANILVVDDDASVRAILARTLLRGGHRITEAASGTEAMGCLRDGVFDLIISDLYMEDGDGVEFLIRLRAGEKVAPKVIIVSGGGFRGTGTVLEIAQYLGAVATLEKPFSSEQLLTIVRDVLDQRT